MAAHPSTEVPLTVADQSRVESNQSTNQNTFRAQDVQQDHRTHMGQIKARLYNFMLFLLTVAKEDELNYLEHLV